MKKMFENKKNIAIIIGIVAMVVFLKNFDVVNYWKSLNPKKGDFIKVGKMSKPRSQHEAILLDEGEVLLLGGGNSIAELYNPKTKKFISVDRLNFQEGHSCPVKLQNGKILLTGGSQGYELKGSQFYNPETKEFEIGPDMNYPRADHTATLLKDGRVLIVGGDDVYYLDKRNIPNEIYNPKTNKFELVSKMNIPRVSHSAILLKDGRVLIVGGASSKKRLSAVEIYDPKVNQFMLMRNMNIERKRANLYPTNEGNVLITGGFGNVNKSIDSIFIKEIEIYNPKINKISIVTKRKSKPSLPAETQLKDGKIFSVGGCTGVGLSLICYTSSEIYDPETNKFIKGKDMNYPRIGHKATLLNDGNVLISGSEGTGRTAELYIYKDKR